MTIWPRLWLCHVRRKVGITPRGIAVAHSSNMSKVFIGSATSELVFDLYSVSKERMKRFLSTQFCISWKAQTIKYLGNNAAETRSSSYVEFVFAPQHRTSCDSEITTKEDFDYWRKITEESNVDVYRRIYTKPNEAEH